MAEPKPLPPSLRLHSRYLVFEIISDEKIGYSDMVTAVWNSMLSLLGEIETADAKMWLIQNLYDEKSQRGVLKCRHDFVEKMRAVLSLIQSVGEKRVIINILGVTGTIKSARNKYLISRDLRSFTGE
jgi:ribonuclease P/MRP protein subunit POP5